MMRNNIHRILAMTLVLAMIVVCILLAQPAGAVECRLEGKPEPVQTDPERVEMLACVIYCEAGGDACSDKCRFMVGDVVLTRELDHRFQDTLEEVLTAPGQYGTFARTGVVWPARASKPEEAAAVARAYDIARRLLAGEHSELWGLGYIWQAEFPQGTDVIYETGLYFGR